MLLFHHADGQRFGLHGPLFHHVGAPIMHGYQTSASPAGEGGAARVAAHAAPLTKVGFPDNLSFFLWLVIIGIIIPGLIIGGLRAGRFQFVFRGR